MKLKRCILLLLVMMALLTVTAMAETSGTDLPTKPPVTEHEHYALCTAPDMCAVCGRSDVEIWDIEHGEKTYEYVDELYHTMSCSACGEQFGRYSHISYCDNPSQCAECGGAWDGIAFHHWDEYEYDENSHWSACALCGEVSYPLNHYAYCDEPDACAVCGAPFKGTLSHMFVDVMHDEEGHWEICAKCGNVSEKSEHSASCWEPGVCNWCDAPYTGSRVEHDWLRAENGHDENDHWTLCKTCGEYIWEPEPHFTKEGDPEGVCSYCGAAYTTEPEATVTPAPTKQPENGNSTAAQTTATSAPAQDDDGFLSRFQGNSSAAAEGDLSGDADVTLVMEANGEADYDGSVLTVFQTGSREDGVAICLSSQYEAAALANFVAWQADIETVEALRATESFKSFVELAEALVESLLPEKTADEVDELIVKLLESGSDGTLENIDADFGDDVDGEIVGYVAEEGYEFFLVLRDDGVELLVREAA